MGACLYQQPQSSAAEPAVSWCQMSDERTPGHTTAYIYILPAPLCSNSPHPVLSLFFVDSICVACRFFQLALSVNPNLFSYQPVSPASALPLLCDFPWPPHVVMSSVHLECRPRSLHIQHLLKVLLWVIMLARCNAGAVGLRREKDIICGVEQKIKTNIDFFFIFHFRRAINSHWAPKGVFSFHLCSWILETACPKGFHNLFVTICP